MAAIIHSERLTVGEYLASPETNRPTELTWGVVREPPAPNWDHQMCIGRLFERLAAHVRRSKLGKVSFAPLDVVLDSENHLVVQPDLVFIAAGRSHIIRDQIWGAPDLVVEVLSPGSRRYDRTLKRAWYAQAGVQELWLVDPRAQTVAVADLAAAPDQLVTYARGQIVRSRVLPRLRLRAAQAFV